MTALQPRSGRKPHPLRSLVDAHRGGIKAAAARHRGVRVRLFGSVARGDENSDSDIDLLVDFTAGSSLFDLLDLTQELEDLLDHSVDVVSTGGLKERDTAIIDEALDL
jgi:predicted nucleotidyltransferase